MPQLESAPWWIFVTLTFAAAALYFTIANAFATQFADDKTREKWVSFFQQQTAIQRYHNLVTRLLNKLTQYFGPSLSVKAFTLCFLLAYIYPIVAFILSWIMGGSHLFSNFALLPEVENQGIRIIYLLGLVVLSVFIAFMVKNNETIDAKATQLIAAKITISIKSADILYRTLCAGICGCLLWLSGYGLLLVLFATIYGFVFRSLAVGVGVVVAGVVVAGVGVVGVVGVVGGVGVGVVGVVGVGVVVVGNYAASLSYFTFFAALPLLNALLDFISWHWSRHFLHQAIQPDVHFTQVLKPILFDLLIALLLLACLCGLLPFMAEGINWLYHLFSDVYIDWQQYARDGRDDPWGKGLFIGVMVITTIIPTTIHLVLALVAMALRIRGYQLGDFIARHTGDRIMYIIAGCWFLAYWLLPAIFVGLVIWLITWVIKIPIAQTLYDLTLLSYHNPSISLPLIAIVLSGLLFFAVKSKHKFEHKDVSGI